MSRWQESFINSARHIEWHAWLTPCSNNACAIAKLNTGHWPVATRAGRRVRAGMPAEMAVPSIFCPVGFCSFTASVLRTRDALICNCIVGLGRPHGPHLAMGIAARRAARMAMDMAASTRGLVNSRVLTN